MDEVAIYMNAVIAMEELCFMDQEADFRDPPTHWWSLPQYHILLYMENVSEVRFAVWGLFLTVLASRQLAFWPMHAVIRIFDRPTDGLIVFNHRLLDNSTVIEIPGNLSFTGSAANPPDNTTDLGISLEAHHQTRVIPTYRGAKMSSFEVFRWALEAMVVAAEQGPNVRCNGLRVDSGIIIRSEYDGRGQSLLWYRHVIKAMKILTRWMVDNDRFAEMDFELQRDGVTIAQGRIQSSHSLESLASQ